MEIIPVSIGVGVGIGIGVERKLSGSTPTQNGSALHQTLLHLPGHRKALPAKERGDEEAPKKPEGIP
jgi:hypothetical protein